MFKFQASFVLCLPSRFPVPVPLGANATAVTRRSPILTLDSYFLRCHLWNMDYLDHGHRIFEGLTYRTSGMLSSVYLANTVMTISSTIRIRPVTGDQGLNTAGHKPIIKTVNKFNMAITCPLRYEHRLRFTHF